MSPRIPAETPIIDAHLHVWDTAELDISWVTAAGLPERSMIPDDDGACSYVLVEADAQDVGHETAWLQEQARRDERVHGLVVSVGLERTDAEQQLDYVADLPEVVGVRRLLQDRDLLGEPGLLHGLRLLAERGLPFDACVRDEELPALADLLDQIPELTVVVDHMGKPPVGDARAMDVWSESLQRLAAMPNLHCKLSGLPAESRDQEELDRVTGAVVGHVVELFGPWRCLVGSDRPVSGPTDGWCRRVLSLLREEHRAAVGHLNAARIYRRRI